MMCEKGLFPDVSIVCDESIADFYNELSRELNEFGKSTCPMYVKESRIHVLLRHPSYKSPDIPGAHWVVLLDDASPCEEDFIMARLTTNTRLKDAKLLAKRIHTFIL